MDPSMYMMNQQQQYYMQQQMMQPQAHYINANMTNHVQENVKGKKPKGRMSSYTFFVQCVAKNTVKNIRMRMLILRSFRKNALNDGNK